MKQRNNLIILSFVLVISLTISLFAQSYSVPSPISAYDIAAWANKGGFIASGSALPSAVASEGALYIDNTNATQPMLYRRGASAWYLVAGGGSGVATHSLLEGLSFAESGHTGFASEAALNNQIASFDAHVATFDLHIASQTDPHGATMTISQELKIGDPLATAVVNIDSPSVGIFRIASYVQLIYADSAPALSSSAVTIWADNASKCVYLHDGSSWANLCGTYGGLHCHDNATSQSIPNGTTYATVTALIDTHESNDVLVSTSTQSITINRAGVYRISFNSSFFVDTNNVVAYFAAFKNETELNQVHTERKIGVAADIGSTAASGFVRLSAGDIITLRARHDYASPVALTVAYGNLNIERVGN